MKNCRSLAMLGMTLFLATTPLAAPVLAIIWSPLHERMSRRIPQGASAGIILFLTFILIVLPGVWLVTLPALSSTTTYDVAGAS